MEIKKFIEKFAEQLDDTSASDLAPEMKFRELDDWSSLTALAVLSMVDDEYNVQLKGNEMRTAKTIQDLFEMVKAKSV